MAVRPIDLKLSTTGNLRLSSTAGKVIDTDLYSRQLYVVQPQYMSKLIQTNVLVCGVQGLGVEVAKNLVLAGPRSVTLWDDAHVTLDDLSSHFYFEPSDVGRPRAEASVVKLSKLNPYVKVRYFTGDGNDAFLRQFQVIVVTQPDNSEFLLRVSDFAHANGIRLVVAQAHGVFASVFTDFGEEFKVLDTDGEDPQTNVVAHISESNPCVVSIDDAYRLPWEDGTYVKFEGLKGSRIVEELNFDEELENVYEIRTIGPYSFELIGVNTTEHASSSEASTSSSSFHYKLGSGYVSNVKRPNTLQFDSWRDALKRGEFTKLCKFTLFGPFEELYQIDYTLHVGFQALLEFQTKHKMLPEIGSLVHINEVVEIAKRIDGEFHWDSSEYPKPALKEEIIEKLADFSRGKLSPMVAFLGGVVAQEVLKTTGKFTPIHQFAYFDASAAIGPNISVEDRKPIGSRYDGQIAVFGKAIQEQLQKLKLFMVGSGALGCELLKNFAMMGIATNPSGVLTVTDMDNIEKSNLSRQFLFRDSDIGKMKSTVAATAAKAMNPDLHIKVHEIPVGEDTEDVFNSEFWSSQDLVVNALDNVKARLYVDRQCVLYQKPLLESGTLGTKANTQVIIPHETQSYGSSSDPQEKEIPVCTLKNFPNTIEHTIEWARDLFSGLFTQPLEELKKYISDPYEYLAQPTENASHKRKLLEGLLAVANLATDRTYENCVRFARLKFEELFSHRIKQLLHSFPADHVLENGVPFWSGSKRAPTPITFDSSDPLHFSFIISTAKVLASTLDVTPLRDPQEVKKILDDYESKVPPFVPSSAKVALTEKEDNESNDEDEEIIENISKSLPASKLFDKFRPTPAQFEKDVDSNGHIDFVLCASNLRARNYGIKEADRQKTKGIAGRIIPAIATTTAMITGLVGMELYKIVQKLPLASYRNAFVNLAISLFVGSEPVTVEKQKSNLTGVMPVKAYPEGHTWWDHLVVEGDLTVDEFVSKFTEAHKLRPISITTASTTKLLWSGIFEGMGDELHSQRRSRKITDLWREITGKNFYNHQDKIELIVSVDDLEDSDIEVTIPTVLLKFR
eukprot:TRINITY_DN1223_c0_g1_i3.p1 TRINITY_DN1223_c0_g1~~TRINITY_DN1223_c0_g1_i3.p1  ORF type:complete len:1075 (+),score=292.55 TRINITY_DN1223_c0_g1_i3:144-3368(+)